jgi:hypothetical protein
VRVKYWPNLFLDLHLQQRNVPFFDLQVVSIKQYKCTCKRNQLASKGSILAWLGNQGDGGRVSELPVRLH